MEKLGPTQFEAEIERLKSAGKLPSLEDVLGAVGNTREQYRDRILQARNQGEDDAKNGK